MQAVTQGILISDPCQPDSPIVYASPGFERLTGYAAEEAIGRSEQILHGPDTDAAAVAQLQEAVRQGRPHTVELVYYRKDGTPFWNAVSLAPVTDPGGRLTHFVSVHTDVTQRRALEEQYRQAQKMEAIGKLAGGVAHDFNNLLTIINGYGQLLLQRFPEGDPTHDLLREISLAGSRAAGLTRQLLAFSRKAVLEPKVLDLRTVVMELDKMLRRILGEDVQLATLADPDLGLVKADPGQVEQVLLNLVVNARDAMPRGGKLTIEIRNATLTQGYTVANPEARTGPHVLLAVSDTGTGMKPDVLAHIFEPFFTTKGENGTGLGLATVHGIVQQGGGHIAVVSEPGRGTTFRVYLPCVPERTPTRGSDPGVQAMPRGSEAVLLVEDEDGVRALSRYVLRSCGYAVLEAQDAAQALRIAERQRGRIHLLITDVVMPGMSGQKLAGRLRQLHTETKVLYLSGFTDEAVVRHGVFQEQVSFLQKPFSPSALAYKVREVLDEH
jgi:PAS domain S-box-containing protein